jgi:hypothetical protein
MTGPELQPYVDHEHGLGGKRNDPRPDIKVYNLRAMTERARLASSLLEKWGLVVAESDGEDTAGRSKLRNATPQEVVDRACDTADLAISEFEKRGWYVAIPSHDEAVEILKARDKTD